MPLLVHIALHKEKLVMLCEHCKKDDSGDDPIVSFRPGEEMDLWGLPICDSCLDSPEYEDMVLESQCEAGAVAYHDSLWNVE